MTRSAVTVSTRHNLEFTYLNPRTNEIDVCTALVDPSETAEAQSKFFSTMSALIRPYPSNMHPSMAPEMQTMDPDEFIGELMQLGTAAFGKNGMSCKEWCCTCCSPCILPVKCMASCCKQ